MKKYLISIVPLAIGILCFILSGVIGSEVLADGTLKEPFFLIPIGYLFLAIHHFLLNIQNHNHALYKILQSVI